MAFLMLATVFPAIQRGVPQAEAVAKPTYALVSKSSLLSSDAANVFVNRIQHALNDPSALTATHQLTVNGTTISNSANIESDLLTAETNAGLTPPGTGLIQYLKSLYAGGQTPNAAQQQRVANIFADALTLSFNQVFPGVLGTIHGTIGGGGFVYLWNDANLPFSVDSCSPAMVERQLRAAQSLAG